MSQNDSFLAELNLLALNAEVKAMREKRLWADIETERLRLKNVLLFALDGARLERKEIFHVLSSLETDSTEEIISKIRFVFGHTPEGRDPAKQFKTRVRAQRL